MKHSVAVCHKCGHEWDQFSIEYPPKIVMCNSCGQSLRLLRVDPLTQAVSYQAIER